MKIVLLESLGVPDHVLEAHVRPLLNGGHTFASFPRDPDPNVQIARAAASETERMALAPSRLLESVPSRSQRMRSSSPCSEAYTPESAGEITRPTLATASRTPLPP